MSEKMYALLLRLYPSSFRKAYGKEALQLVRDRAQDERGFLSSLRLWFDLLGDLALSLPREYRSVQAAVIVPQAHHLGDGTPSFQTLEAEALHPRSFIYGGLVSLVVYGSILVLIGHGGNLLRQLAPDIQRAPGAFETIPARPPTIALSCLPANPTPRSTVSLTATVSALGGPTATGSVRFFDGITVLKVGELNNGTVTVTGKLPHTTKHLLRATYLGNAYYSPVSSVERR